MYNPEKLIQELLEIRPKVPIKKYLQIVPNDKIICNCKLGTFTLNTVKTENKCFSSCICFKVLQFLVNSDRFY